MNMHDTRHHPSEDQAAEMLEQLRVFLPRSVMNALREQVPPGQRRAFIARALRAALGETVQKRR